MSARIEPPMNEADGPLTLLQILAENTFHSILIIDATAEGKIIYASKS